MPRERATQTHLAAWTGPGALRRRGVTGLCRSYTALVVAAPTSSLEKTAYDYVLRIPLPGVVRHTLRWHLKDDTLNVSGDWEGENVSGVVFGSVYRSVTLPPDAIPAGFETGLEAGGFVIRIPRRS